MIVFELVGEVGGRGRVCALVWRLQRELGLLGVEVVESALETRQSLFAQTCSHHLRRCSSLSFRFTSKREFVPLQRKVLPPTD
jgi:hypothetical protein